MSLYLGSLRDQRPVAADALEMVTDDLATRLVPFPRFPCEPRREAKSPRRAWDILSEIEKTADQIRQLFDDRNELDDTMRQMAGERFRQLALELAGK